MRPLSQFSPNFSSFNAPNWLSVTHAQVKIFVLSHTNHTFSVRNFFDALVCDSDFGQNPRKIAAYSEETFVTNFFSAHVQCTFAKVAEKFPMKKQQKLGIWNVAQKKVSSERSCCKSQTQFWQPWPINVVKTPQLARWIVGKSYILYKLSEKFVPNFFSLLDRTHAVFTTLLIFLSFEVFWFGWSTSIFVF